MKASGILSALIFAHAALAQATGSTSAAVSAATDSASPSATGSASSSVTLTSPSASVSESASASPSASNSKAAGTGTKSSSAAAGSSAAAATTSSVADSKPAGTGTSMALAATQSPVASSSGNPLVPASASSGCQDYLNKLNSDTAMSSCLTPLITALSSFTSGSASASSVTKSLNNLCASNACSASTMRTILTAYSGACSNEMSGSSPDTVIVQNYDVLYTLIPMKQAMCSKDADSQAYCLLNIGSGSSAANTTQNLATGPSDAVKYAQDHLANAYVASSRRRAAQSVLVPNADTYRNTNLMYLFTSPDMNAGELCTSCTQQIVSKYVAFESSTPYALGLKNSPMLGGQSALWTAIQDKCPATFLAEVSNIAGVGLTADETNAASPALAGSTVTALVGALAAAFAFI